MNALRPLIAAFVLLAWLVSSAMAREWQTFEDPELGYHIVVPVDVFDEQVGDASNSNRLVLRDLRHGALLEVVGGANEERLSVREFGDLLSRSDRIGEVTYRRQGRTWLVLSGHYAQSETRQEPLVFYAKFMFSADLTRFAGFEISYPAAVKSTFDPLVELIEDGFRGPGSR